MPPPRNITQSSGSALQIKDALILLQDSRERMNSLVLETQSTNGTKLKPTETLTHSEHDLEEKISNDDSLRRSTLSFQMDEQETNFQRQTSIDSLSVLRPRLPTIINEFKDYNVHDMIDDQATLTRSRSRHLGIEIKLKGLGFSVFCPKDDQQRLEVKTVYNQSFPYKLFRFILQKCKVIFNKEEHPNTPQLEERFILKDVNLHLIPGKNYLILGPPASGKTSLLKAIASLLDGQSVQGGYESSWANNYRKGCVSKAGKRVPRKGDTCIHGSISYDGFFGGYRRERDVRSSVVFVDQLDHHAPRLTVQETFDFAFQCKTGGTHSPHIQWHRAFFNPRSSVETMVTTFQRFFLNMDKHNTFINILLECLDLNHVKNTFVGDTANVRGVSGGQRRRVSIGEMLSSSINSSTAIFCGDEISTGLVSRSIY
jgi:ABC-type multidrug transport system ATPase subunit